MVKAYDLLEREADDDASEPNYTDRQTQIIQLTLEDPDAEVEEVAEQANDSHPNYVRDILTRVDLDIIGERDEFSDVLDSDDGESAETESEAEAEEAEEDVEPEQEPDEEPQELPEDARVGEWEDADDVELDRPEGFITVKIEDEIPLTAKAEIPQDVIYRAIRDGASIAPKPDRTPRPERPRPPNMVELDGELVSGLAEKYEVSDDRARQMVLKIGTDRARELIGEYPEDIEAILEEETIKPEP